MRSPSFSRIVVAAVVSAVLFCAITRHALAQRETPAAKADAGQQTYLLHCPTGQSNVELKAVGRNEVKQDVYIDVTGLRLYADSPENRRNAYERLLGTTSSRFHARQFITDTLSKLRAETGIEPDMVPVRGRRGKELGAKGMVLIEGGSFTRPGRYLISNYVAKPYEVKGEKYTVRISSFWIDKYKVTNQQYCDFLNDNNQAYYTPWNPRIVKDRSGLFVPADPLLADIPVVSVHWFQAAGYARWAEKRLPTEAEWEFAAGGSEGRKYPWGNEEPDKTRANFFGSKRNTPGDAFPAGATPEGVFDLVGNAAEWIADYYDEDDYRTAPKGGVLIDPNGPQQGTASKNYRRMFKGICKGYEAPGMLCVFKRHSRPPLLPAAPGIGFRCVKSVEEAGQAGEKADGRDASSVSYTKLARSLVRYPKNPVIEVGKKGDWDDQTLGCFTVLEDGERFFFFSGGTQFGKPKNIGMATSPDGIHWKKYEKNPLFPGSMPYAIKVGDTFRLYHPGKDAADRHGLQMRTSDDGFHWSQPKRVLAGGIMDPCVVRVAENRFHLYYCGGGRKAKNGKQVWEFKAYVATSEDGITWKKEPKPALKLGPKGSWDEQSHAGPCVLKLEDGFHMWYLGSGVQEGKMAWRIGHATSRDGLNWTRSGKDPVLDVGKAGDWDGGTFMSFDIIFRNGKFLFWYAAAPTGHGDETKMKIQIGHGTSQ